MANQINIDIGAAANDGTGDPLRTAFNYVNNNFSNVWNTGLPNSNVQFSDNRILTVNTNANLVLAPNGIAKVVSNVSILPNISNVHSVGGTDRRWNTVYAQYLDVSNDTTFSNLIVTGNLTVQGNTIQIGNIVTDTKTIQLANTAGTANAANGSGITVGASDNIATLLYNSTSNTWTTNIGISAVGNVSGTYILGNLAFANGLPSTYGNANVAAYLPTYTGNLSANNISAGNVFTASTITAHDAYISTGTFTGDENTGDAALYVGSPSFTNLGTDVMAQFTGNVNGYGQINFQNYSNSVIASGDYIVTSDNGNDSTHFIDMGMTSSTWDGTQENSLGNALSAGDGYVYVQDGNLVLAVKDGIDQHVIKLDLLGNLTVPGNIIPTANNAQSLGSPTQQWNDLYLSNATIYMNSVPISLTAGNVLTVNGADVVTTAANGESSIGNLDISGTVVAISASSSETLINITPSGPVAGWAYLQLPTNDTANTDDTRLHNDAGNIEFGTGDFSTGETNYIWTLGADGGMTIPGEIVGLNTITLDNRATSNTADIRLNAADDIFLQGGDKLADLESEGGDIFLYAGDGANAATSGFDTGGGGDVQIEGGLGGTSFGGGSAGSGGGIITIAGGDGGSSLDSTVGSGGAVNIRAGSAADPISGDQTLGGFGGDVNITAGHTTRINESGGSISLNTGGAFGSGTGAAGYVEINIASSNVGPGGVWTFGGTGTTLNVPANAEIYGANAGNLTVGCAGNTIVTSSDYGANVKNWVFGYTGNLTVPGNIQTPTTGFPFSSDISGIITGAATVVVTLVDSEFGGPYTGQVTISGVVGTTQANSTWYFEAVEVSDIQLYNDPELTSPVDGTTWTAYESGGLAVALGYNDLSITGGNVSVITNSGSAWTFADNGTTVFPTLTVDIHNGGNQSAQTLKFGDPAQQVIITGPTPAVNNSAQRLIIQGQRGNGTGEGGDVYLWAGDAQNNGGDIKIYAGDADAGTAGDRGGYVNIDGGAGYDRGGQVEITGGYSSSGDGGYVNLIGGGGTAHGGNVGIQGGYGQAGPGGVVSIQGGGSNDGVTGYGNVSIAAGASTWQFDNTGNLNLPQAGIVYETNIPFGGLTGKTIALKPYGGTDADQQLLVYPTAGADFNHLHLTTGNLYNTEMFLGNDDFYVKLANTGNIVINANDNTGNTAQWIFGTEGTILNSGNLTLQTPNGVPGAVTAITGSSGSWESNPQSNLATTTGGGGVGLTVNVTETGGYASAIAIATPGTGYSDGDVISVVSGSSDASFTISVLANGWTIDNTGNLTVAGSIIMPPNSSLVGSGSSPAPSISGFGTISSANVVTGFISLDTGRINGGESTVVTDGINSIALALGATMDVYGFPFAGGPARGQLTISGITSTTQANGTWYYQSVDNDHTYQLYTDSTYSTLVDASGWTAYTGGGSVAITQQDPRANIVINSNGYFSTFDNTGKLNLPGNLDVVGNITGNTAGYAIGYRDIPQVSFAGDTTIATTDAGKHYYSTESTDYTLTIANNASQGFQVGAAITVVNQGTGNITIAQGSGVTLYMAGNASSGNRSVATFGMATIMKVATDTWFVSGAGVA